MVWACFNYYGKSDLVFIDTRINSERYIEVLENNFNPFVLNFGGQNPIFQQDNAPVHTSSTTRNWLAQQNYKILDWPAKSPDLNPIEICGEFSQEMFIEMGANLILFLSCVPKLSSVGQKSMIKSYKT